MELVRTVDAAHLEVLSQRMRALAEQMASKAADAGKLSAASPVVTSGPTDTTPWSGEHFTFQEGRALGRATPTTLLAVVGPSDAGKTSLLASFFLQLANGRRPGFPYRFAGCRSLRGFRALTTKAAAWQGREGEEIVGHTPREESEDPQAFLHLSLRHAEEPRTTELLLSDVSGEWFAEWATLADDRAARRLPFLPNCAAVLVLVDSHAVSSEGGGVVDQRTAGMLRRLYTETRSWARRPDITLAYTKIDKIADDLPHPPAPDSPRPAWGTLGRRTRRTWGAIEEGLAEGHAVHMSAVSAFPCPLADGQPFGVTELFGGILGRIDTPRRWPATAPGFDVSRPFLTMRRGAR